MALSKNSKDRGPGLLYIVAAIVIVAVAGARFLGFTPGANVDPGRDPGGIGRQTPGDEGPDRIVPRPSDMTEVLVYHTHTTENYSPKGPTDNNGPGDIVTVGRALVAALKSEGVESVHVMTVHDLPRWNEAFDLARRSVQKELGRHDGVRVLIDVHRDAVPEGNGEGYATVQVGGADVARILLVVGSVDNPLAEQNVRFATMLQERLEAIAPGISRGVRLLNHDTTGDLHPNTVTAYIGDYRDNSVEEAERSARFLAQAIAQLLSEIG